MSKSARIRELLDQGYSVAQIAKITGDRYQFVRQVALAVGRSATQVKTADSSNWSGWKDELTPEEHRAVQDYCSSGYHILNKVLRKGPEYADEWSDKQASLMTLLDSAVEKGKLHRPVVVFRGGRSTHFEGLEIGDEFLDKGFGSVSKTLRTAIQFAKGALFTIHLPVGHLCSDVHVTKLGVSTEGEIIVARNTVYRVDNIEVKSPRSGWRDQKWYTVTAVRREP